MPDISYQTSCTKITPNQLKGFFAEWKEKPTPEKHLSLLRNSDFVVLAIHQAKVVGFITAISDKVLSAYIPFLEVIPEYQSYGIGSALIERILKELDGHYMIDLLCDTELQSYYEQFNMKKAVGMYIRNYEHQTGM